MTSTPHGGILIDRILPKDQQAEAIKRAKTLPALEIRERDLDELFMIAIGAFSPLTGFMCEQDYRKVVANMRLDSGLIWSLPIVLPISDADAKRLSPGRDIALTFNHKPVAIMNVQDNFERDTEYEIEQVYGTTDPKHPGVAIILSEPKTLIGGPVEVLQDRSREGLDAYLLTPKETRAIMDEKGWKTVVAFQTRNPIHRAHEYLQKCALEYVDGLLIHPVVGATKEDDLPADIRMKSYEVALEKYYPKDRVLLSTMKTAMRYAGPREAVFHIMVRKNFGCTHFIVGRDHAGVGDYYDTYGAHRIFDPFTPEELGITPIRFDHAFYCKKCEGMSTSKTCPHTDADRVILSGTKVRKMLKDGTCPPPEFTRPEVAALLIEHAKQSK